MEAILVWPIGVPPLIAENGPIFAVVAVLVIPHVTVDCAYAMLPMANMTPNISMGIINRLIVI
jgi:hypothetical protein